MSSSPSIPNNAGLIDTGNNLLTSVGNLAVLAIAVVIVIGLLLVLVITKMSAKAVIVTLLVGGIALWGAAGGGVAFVSHQVKQQTTDSSGVGGSVAADFSTK